jgi:hypothetical protein
MTAQTKRERYAVNKAAGICVLCYKNPAIPDRVKCQECTNAKSEYLSQHIPEHSEASRKHREKLYAAGICSRCKGPIGDSPTKCCNECRIKNNEEMRVSLQELRLNTMNIYGGCKCALCSETELVVLSIDHIEGGGVKHRKEIGNGDANIGASKFYRWLRDNNYPPGYRVLCMNCQFRERARLHIKD